MDSKADEEEMETEGAEGEEAQGRPDEDGSESEEEDPAAAFKRAKPISLSAVPSFYDQDLKRIKTIHAELMAASMQDHARHKLEEVTAAYNTGKLTPR